MLLEKIHSDDRGSISIMTGLQSYPEVTVFQTKAGHARGGCIHRLSKEFVCVIEGIISYVTPDDISVLTAGESYVIEKETPHYFVSVTDSVVLEWGATVEEKKEKDPLFRAIVDKINDTTD